jgi:hypothetical protein
MLKTVEISRAKKTKGIAVTYRAGTKNKYGTCPIDCKMNCSGTGTKSIDWEYFDALLDAVPSKGVSFTYSHFDWNLWAHKQRVGQTVINFSTENVADAVVASQHVPTVIVVGANSKADWKNFEIERSDIPDYTVKVVRCPAEYRDISCAQCGNGEPLCARLNRNFIVGFTAHGPSKRAASDLNIRGGCYADAGNCRIWWDETANASQDETDGEKLKRFVSGLPPRSIVRHHVAGDIGAE